MTDINPSPSWAAVRQLEIGEFALGGANGNMNKQAKSLAARSELLKKYAALPYESKTGGYALNERVQLATGDVVRSTIASNVNNPNENMTGWVKANDASQIFDNSGMDLAFVNETIKTEINIATRLSKADFKKLQDLDKTLDITAYLKNICDEYSAKRTNADPTYGNAQGLLKVVLPKGVYTLSPNQVKISGAYGFLLEGDGVATTTILCKSDSGVYFDFTPYLWVKFKGISIIHQPQNTIKATWSNSLLKLNGWGGGKRLKFEDAYIVGFNKQIEFVSQNNANEDTTYAENCLFAHFNTFLYSRSSQAVNNSFTRCSWGGVSQKCFDVTNYGHTHISDSGVVQSGSFFHLASQAGFYGPTAQFTLTNVKFEWYNPSGTQANGTTKIISTDDDIQISAYFKLIKCGIAGGSGDQSINHFDLKAGSIIVDVDGGEWAGVNIGIKGFAVGSLVHNRSWVRFANCAAPPNFTINRTSQNADSVAPPVIFKNNSGSSDIVKLGTGLANERYLLTGDVQNKNCTTGRLGRLVTGTTTENHSVLTYGQVVVVDSVRIIIKSSTGATNAKARVYADSSKSVLLKELPIVAQTSPQAINIAEAIGVITSEGIYVEVLNENTNISISGFIQVVSTSI